MLSRIFSLTKGRAWAASCLSRKPDVFLVDEIENFASRYPRKLEHPVHRTKISSQNRPSNNSIDCAIENLLRCREYPILSEVFPQLEETVHACSSGRFMTLPAYIISSSVFDVNPLLSLGGAVDEIDPSASSENFRIREFRSI